MAEIFSNSPIHMILTNFYLKKIVCFLQIWWYIDVTSVDTDSIWLSPSIDQLFKKWFSKWEVNVVSIFYALYWHFAIGLYKIYLYNHQIYICNLIPWYFQQHSGSFFPLRCLIAISDSWIPNWFPYLFSNLGVSFMFSGIIYPVP